MLPLLVKEWRLEAVGGTAGDLLEIGQWADGGLLAGVLSRVSSPRPDLARRLFFPSVFQSSSSLGRWSSLPLDHLGSIRGRCFTSHRRGRPIHSRRPRREK